MNKTSNNFLTQLNILFQKTNYQIQLIEKLNIKDDIDPITDDIYKEKIMNADDIDNYEFLNICDKINNTNATESEKFSFYKYKFKSFWQLTEITKQNIDDYFRCEKTMNRLCNLYNKPLIDSDYIDHDVNKKMTVVKNIISTLGFDLHDFSTKLSKDEYYNNVSKLLSNDNDFTKNYEQIRILFKKDKHQLKNTIKGPSLSNLLNGFLEEFGIKIKSTEKRQKIGNNKYKSLYIYSLSICTKFKQYMI